jgi:hypothetical protein
MKKMTPSNVPGKKAGPNGSFPIGDAKHARLAIGGATRSYNAGNISASTESKIKAEARAALSKPKQTAPAPAKKVPSGSTAPAAAKAVPFASPKRAFPMDAAHSGNAEKRGK